MENLNLKSMTITDWPYVWNRPPFFHNNAAEGQEDSSAQVSYLILEVMRSTPDRGKSFLIGS